VPEDAQLARQATLWGGNLTMLTSLMGTRHFPQIKKGVLFLEDVGEHPYRIERMLSQLLHGGVIQAQQLVVLGQFTQYQLHAMDRGFNMAKVVGWLRSQTRTPVITGLPFGHVATKVCLPFGVKVDVATQGQDALILWGHMH
jgi:muramoyltetrapeptide carboxypeptidase